MTALFRWFSPVAAVLLMAAGPAPATGPDRPAPAIGPDRPVLTPGRDAIVGYHLSPATGEPIDVRVGLRSGGAALRVDLPDQSYMLAVPPTKGLVLVVPLERTALNLPWSDGPQSLFLLDERMRFTRKGEATVAGQRCTQYDTVLERARSTVCVTADGVVLRAQSQDPQGRRNLVEAFAIRYQPLPEGEFVVPADFEHLSAGPGQRAP